MTVKTPQDAWKIADMLMNTDYERDDKASERAGYPIYNATDRSVPEWISDLTDRLEVNRGGKTTNIWILDNMKNPARGVLEERIEELKVKLNNDADFMNELTKRLKEVSDKYRFAKMIRDVAQDIFETTKIVEELEDRLEDIKMEEERIDDGR